MNAKGTRIFHESVFEQNVLGCDNFRERCISSDLIENVLNFIRCHRQKFQASHCLDYVEDALCGKSDDFIITWFPAYNCALVAKRKQGCLRERSRMLFLVGAANHDMRLQREWTSDEVRQTNGVLSYCGLPIALIKAVDFKKFLEYFEEEFDNLYQEDKKERLGRHKKMSPAFVQFALDAAHRKLTGKENNVGGSLQGGWPDVFDHTGGEWPLLSAVIEFIAGCSPFSHETLSHSEHQRFVCQLLLDLLKARKNEVLSKISDRKVGNDIVCEQINEFMTMMAFIARKVVNELAGIYPIHESEMLLDECRRDLDNHVNERWSEHAECYRLKKAHDIQISNWSINISCATIVNETKDREKIINMARSNIALVPLRKTSGCKKMLNLVNVWDQYKFENAMFFYLKLNTIEHFIYELASNVINPNFRVCIFSVEKLINEYRKCNRQLLAHLKQMKESKSDSCASGLIVELLSNEMLIMWTGFALIHNTLKKDIPLLCDYGVPLRWADMSLLVLSKKEAQTAALRVSEYLKRNTKDDNELFCFNGQTITFHFALKFAEESPDLLEIWKNEEAAAERRKDEQWKKILENQACVSQLEKKSKELEYKLSLLYKQLEELEVHEVKTTYLKWKLNYRSPQWRSINSQIEFCKTEISKKRRSLVKAKNPPKPIFQPLPKDRSQALRILFFLHMPNELNLLARIAISARQIMLPSEDFRSHTALDVDAAKAIGDYVRVNVSSWTSLTNYYNDHSPSKISSGKALRLFSEYAPAKPSHVGPSNVMDFQSPSEAVWHPDELKPTICWNGGGFPLDSSIGGYFDPFVRIEEIFSIEYFTEKISDGLQFTMTQYGKHTKSTRSNEAIARQDVKPSFMNKAQWFTFASLRAYPNQQLRKLCCALSDRSLPFEQPVVHTLVQQVLYHIGELSLVEGNIQPVWKTDMFQGEFLGVIAAELRSLGTEIAAKPSQRKTLLLLIEIASYVSQWNDECVLVLRSFVKILDTWIAIYSDQIAKANIHDVPCLSAKKALLYNYAVLCYSCGALTSQDLNHLLELLVRAQNETKLNSNNPWHDQLRNAIDKRHKVMTSRAIQIVEKLNIGGDKILTNAVRTIITDVPECLIWANLKWSKNGNFSSFEASDGNGNIFSINVMNGIVLCNGLPPAELPQTILHHSLYKRIFGNQNFETHLTGNVIQTAHPVGGSLYSFKLDNEVLLVKEKDIETVDELTLLNSVSFLDKASWGYDLPDMLKKNFSHWYCPKREAILFRGIYFLDRAVHFILLLRNEKWRCYRIPSHLKEDIWSSYCEEQIPLERRFDELVKLQSSTLNVLRKFDIAENIHCYQSPNGSIRYHFPRFDLEFYSDPNLLSTAGYRVCSRDYFGYHLSPQQQLHDTLLGFEQYLVLEHDEKESADTKVVIPQGKVIKSRGLITVEAKNTENSSLKVYTYDVHPRFRTLVATSIHSRLHLADLYAACSTLLPERRMQMCGSEVAMQLVRRSWTNQPLSKTDYDKLESISQHSYLTPALDLLCHELACSSLQTDFLHSSELKIDVDEDLLTLSKTASAEYMQESFPRNIRISLTPEEEIRVLGARRLTKSKTPFILNQPQTTCLPDCLLHPNDETVEWEKLLRDMVKTTPKKKNDFPLQKTNDDVSKLRKYVLKELKESHDAFFDLGEQQLTPEFESIICSLFLTIKEKRETVEASIIKVIKNIPKCDYKTECFRILRSVNIYPVLTLEDIVKCAIDRSWFEHFNPFLLSESSKKLHNNILIWMKLCVLEDKMNRLKLLCKQLNFIEMDSRAVLELQVLQEVSAYRTWSAEDYPQWLAFEVISQLQIRPIQYTVAQSIINEVQGNLKGPITQLNMGEGKTRVILPMLAMYWRYSENMVRFNFLSALLQEAGDYLHSVLTATVLGLKVFYFPFNRDVKLTPETTDTLALSLEHCSESGGVIICAPEHRMSLKLKWYEMTVEPENNEGTHSAAQSETDWEIVSTDSSTEISKVCKTLEKIDGLRYLDVLDEVDEILRTKNKLIYAVGSQEQLPCRTSRVNIIQGLLDVVASNDTVKLLLQIPHVTQGKVGKMNASFQEFRIVQGKNFDLIEKTLIRCFAEQLILNPAFELKWMRQMNGRFRSDVLDYVTKSQESEFNYETIKPSHLDDVLALRGLLASGLFVHCLMKRNRVDYGVNRLDGKKKLMAVPFRACEIPSLRAEFGHPDCALIYTCLAYYYDGLSFEQVQEAFKTLLLLGKNAQKSIYREWYDLCSSQMTFDDQSTLDDVAKIDLTNSVLASQLFEYFKKNMKTINFWLNNCVFPTETAQFPYRLEATAWDLADNSWKQVAGFSGTNDDRLIMPTSLEWVEQTDLSLLATDGKMLQLLQKSKFESLRINDEKMKWKLVLNKVIEKVKSDTTHVTCALIDAGALMAGASNNVQVASYLAQFLDKGVIYFDIGRNGWWVRDKLGREWPKHSSPIHERDGFVYFDESRTRGADMKLNPNACAVLTLGPQMCKDKLMQAAGRMRMLEHGQLLHLLATEDVASKIRSENHIDVEIRVTANHVLRWVMANSVENIEKWLLEWAFQGGYFSIKQESPELALISETISLKELYGHEFLENSVNEAWMTKRNILRKRCENQMEVDAEKVDNGTPGNWTAFKRKDALQEIDRRIQEYGSDCRTKNGSQLEEEYERELEAEIEIEEEVLREIPSREPRSEIAWDVANLAYYFQSFYLKSATALQKFVERNIHFKQRAIGSYGESGRTLNWPPNVYGTENFFHTISSASGLTCYNDYMRLVDCFLVFPNDQVLLLSEREADEVLKLTWTSNCSNFTLMNLTYARKCKNNERVRLQSPQKTLAEFKSATEKSQVSDKTLAALSVFQGLVMFPKAEERREVQMIVNTSFAKEVACLFCDMRGLGFTYSRSDLETICT